MRTARWSPLEFKMLSAHLEELRKEREKAIKHNDGDPTRFDHEIKALEDALNS